MADTPSSQSEGNSFDVTIDDTSPTIVYSPFGDSFGASNASDGWNPCYSLTGAPACDSSSGQDNTTATSLHATASDGASMTLDWNGTAVSLYGYFPTNNPSFPSALSYSVSLDGISTTNYVSQLSSGNISQDILASFTSLTNGAHSVQLTMHNPGGLSGPNTQLLFGRAVITSTTPLSPSSHSQSNSTIATQVFPDSTIAFHGEWSFSQDLLPGEDLAFHTSTNVGDSASMEFNGLFHSSFPSAGTAIVLEGLTTPLSGAYNITLDNETPQSLSARSSFNSSTVLFFRTGLDPTVTHQLTIENVGASAEGEGTFLAIGSVNVTYVAQNGGGARSTSAMSSSSLSHGAIAGIVVATVIGGTFLLIGLTYCIYRRRQATRRKQKLIVNPRMSFRQRLSFISRPAQPPQADMEKQQEAGIRDSGYSNPILDIGGRKEEGSDDGMEGNREGAHLSPEGADSRHASQKSDGSYAISLPELSCKGGLAQTFRRDVFASRPSSGLDGVPNIADVAALSRATVSNPSQSKAASQGILLREMYTPTADVPVDVRDTETEIPTNSTFLPAPTVSPLRVNFDEELAEHAERKKEGKFRSGVSGISLPQSFRQAFTWGHDPNRQSISQVTIPDTARPRDNRYSFLDMESTRSNSVSGAER
ncbi:hypothetical protein NM688_g7009 [Phlebia brevispora]|uniref:Uncharacterized protein n=1 Tax=Phlebia brevispora TaxID=194682 RepID=A0ACC1SA09_9APHY|nr:hypothetical protein NM688_g7009 [Phlebia brevispora]